MIFLRRVDSKKPKETWILHAFLFDITVLLLSNILALLVNGQFLICLYAVVFDDPSEI